MAQFWFWLLAAIIAFHAGVAIGITFVVTTVLTLILVGSAG